MSKKEELKSLIEKEQEEALVTFLIALRDDEREALVSTVKELVPHYRTLKKTKVYLKPENRYIGSQKQIKMTHIASFCCLNQKDFELIEIIRFYYKNFILIIDEYNILSSYCPKWFNSYMHKNPSSIENYKYLLDYTEKGYITPNKELIFIALTRGIAMEIDEIPVITTQEHIWYLFEQNFWVHGDDERQVWFELFKKLIDTKRLDMKKVINSAINALYRENVDVDFFVGLIAYLKPSKSVLVSLQEAFMGLCESDRNRVIHLSIRYLRDISTDSKFDIELFIDKSAILLSNQNKAILNATISVLDKLMKLYADRKEALALILTQALSMPDKAIQIRILKIIKKYKLLENSAILDEITLYDTLFYEAKEMLPSMPKIEKVESEIIIKKDLITDDNRVPTYESFEEMLFFFTQIFEAHTLYDFDMALALLPKLDVMIKEDNVAQLQIIFSNTEKLYRRGGYNKGAILYMLVNLIFRYAIDIQKRFSSQSIFIQEIFDRNRELKSILHTLEIGEFYQPFFELIAWTETCLYANTKYPILSTPTHKPCVIALDVLVDKLAYYQAHKISVNINDFQIALNRVSIEKNNAIEKLNGEYKDIFLYLFGHLDFDITLVKTPALWVMALLRKNIKSDIELFAQKYEDEVLTTYPYSLPKWDIETCEHKNIHILLKDKNKEIKQENIFSKITTFNKDKRFYFDDYYDIHTYDGARFLLLSPYNLEYVIYFIIKIYLLPRSYYKSNPMRQAINIIPTLYELWDKNNVGELSYLYLALALIDKDKNVRLIATELWIKAVSEETMDNTLLGQTLGRLEKHSYAPLKRLSDLIISNILGLSALYTRALEELLSSMIKQMNDEPLNGLKKLLEIYLEVLSLSKQKPSTEVLEKLSVWGEVKSLSVVVKKIILI